MSEQGNYDESRNNRVYSKTVRAGKRTYFVDVRTTRSNDYYITLTESKRRYQDGAFIKRKLFLYKEDFNKFLDALTETINHVKTELIPDYDYDQFSHKRDHYESGSTEAKEETKEEPKQELSDTTQEEVVAETTETTDVTDNTESIENVEKETTSEVEDTSSTTLLEHAEELDSELSFDLEEEVSNTEEKKQEMAD